MAMEYGSSSKVTGATASTYGVRNTGNNTQCCPGKSVPVKGTPTDLGAGPSGNVGGSVGDVIPADIEGAKMAGLGQVQDNDENAK